MAEIVCAQINFRFLPEGIVQNKFLGFRISLQKVNETLGIFRIIDAVFLRIGFDFQFCFRVFRPVEGQFPDQRGKSADAAEENGQRQKDSDRKGQYFVSWFVHFCSLLTVLIISHRSLISLFSSFKIFLCLQNKRASGGMPADSYRIFSPLRTASASRSPS